MSLLRLEKVSRRFGGIRAVSDLDAAVEEGSITAFIGPNGAGKTTLFNAISGLFPPSAGRVLLGDPPRDITGRPPHRIARMGLSRTYQTTRLFPGLTVLDNVKIGFHGRTSAGFLRSALPWAGRAEERAVTLAGLRCLDFVGLAGVAGEEAGSLPYGRQRLVEIARALAPSPQLLLLDEPAAGMNPVESEALVALIRRIRSAGVTVGLIEHDMRVVMNVSDRVYVLDHGEKIAEGTPAEVCRDPAVMEAYLGSAGAGAVPGEAP